MKGLCPAKESPPQNRPPAGEASALSGAPLCSAGNPPSMQNACDGGRPSACNPKSDGACAAVREGCSTSCHCALLNSTPKHDVGRKAGRVQPSARRLSAASAGSTTSGIGLAVAFREEQGLWRFGILCILSFVQEPPPMSQWVPPLCAYRSPPRPELSRSLKPAVWPFCLANIEGRTCGALDNWCPSSPWTAGRRLGRRQCRGLSRGTRGSSIPRTGVAKSARKSPA